MPRSRVAASTGPISNVKFTETAPPSERTQVSRVRFYVLRAPQVGVDSGTYITRTRWPRAESLTRCSVPNCWPTTSYGDGRLWIGWFGQVPPTADESGENSAWLWLTIKDSRLAHRCDLRVPLRELHRRLSPPSQRNPTGFGCGYRHARRSSARSSSRR